MFGLLFGSSESVTAGETFNFEITVAPLGMSGRVMVEDAHGDVVVEKGETYDDVKNRIRDMAIELWHRDNYGSPDGFIITHFKRL